MNEYTKSMKYKICLILPYYEVFPNYFLDYREESEDKSVRWLFRTHSDEGDWSGNLYDFYYKVINRIDDDIAVPFVNRKDGYRVDLSLIHI